MSTTKSCDDCCLIATAERWIMGFVRDESPRACPTAPSTPTWEDLPTPSLVSMLPNVTPFYIDEVCLFTQTCFQTLPLLKTATTRSFFLTLHSDLTVVRAVPLSLLHLSVVFTRRASPGTRHNQSPSTAHWDSGVSGNVLSQQQSG